jgi:GNAT superfamily N-acetyltransferase
MLQLKQAEIADAPAISLLHAASWRVAYRGLLPQDYLDSMSDTRWGEPFTKQLSGDGIRALLAYEGDAPAGCVSYGEPVGMEGALPPPPGWGYVLALYVHPDHTKKGYGTALRARADNGLRQQGYMYCFQ